MEKRFGRILQITIFGLLVVLSGCNPSKKAARKAAKLERKAEKHLYKSISFDPMPFTIECAQKFNPIDSIHERIIYKPGKVVTDTLIETEIDVVRDTVVITNTRTVYIKQTDTVDLSRFQTESNKAAQDSLKRHFDKERERHNLQVNSLTEALNKEQVEHSATKQSLKIYKTGFYIMLAIIVVYVGIKLFWGKIMGWFKR